VIDENIQPQRVIRAIVGPWQEHPERAAVIAAHADILWTLLERFSLRIRTDLLFRREMNRIVKEATWAATEITIRAKYNLQFVSEGVVRACERLGALNSWARNSKMLNHEHVGTREELRELVYRAESHQTVLETLLSAEGCVVMRDEHLQLSRSKAAGWARYRDVGIAVFDRLRGVWRQDCGIPPL
jgi:hypothetical protein